MNLNSISEITSTNYGFKVFNWDDSKDGDNGSGLHLFGKVQFTDPSFPKTKPTKEEKSHINSFVIQILLLTHASTELSERQRNEASYKPHYCVWSVKDSNEEIARKMFKTFNFFKEVEIEGKKFKPTSIYVKGSESPNPFLLIMGSEV